MLVMSIPTNITLTGNHTLTNFHVSGSVDITPNILKMETTSTETRFCKQRKGIKLHIRCLEAQNKT